MIDYVFIVLSRESDYIVVINDVRVRALTVLRISESWMMRAGPAVSSASSSDVSPPGHGVPSLMNSLTWYTMKEKHVSAQIITNYYYTTSHLRLL